jgi:hypothetical protein
MNARTGLLDFRVWWLPQWLYEALPFLYLLGGLIAIVAFDCATGRSSGLLFCVAGVSILLVRWQHRTAQASCRTAPPRLVPSQASARSYYNDPWG